MNYDIAVIGAGPVGLCLARSLAGTGMRILLIEKQAEAALADPAFDGREIALTHRSARLLRELGIWGRIAGDEISPLRDARIWNGDSPRAMDIRHDHGRTNELGYLIPNHLIRRAAFESLCETPEVVLLAGTRVTDIRSDGQCARLRLANGESPAAALVIAADSRFSETRRAMGIPAAMHDFGRTMLVCRMAHDVPHHHVAWEWFDYGQTLALLPLPDLRQSSVVVTLPQREVEPLMDMDTTAFARDMERRFRNRAGAMRLVSTRHAYPLVGVYPRHFVARRYAVVGDAAVGMHPVTAHGFNLGLLGEDLLSRAIKSARDEGGDIASPGLLSRYERELRRASRPLYLATRFIAALYTNESLPARWLRDVALRIGNRLTPFKTAVASALVNPR